MEMRIDRMRSILLFVIFLVPTTLTNAQEYRGVGGQVEAYGTIVGFYLSGVKAAERCGSYTSLKLRSTRASKTYVRTNKPVYDQATSQIEKLAESNGGIKEKQRLKEEIRKAYAELEDEVNRQLEDVAKNESDCRQVLTNLEEGFWDLKVRAGDKLQLLNIDTRNNFGNYPPALIKGILEGCIDSQKRSLHKQGIDYTMNEELVRQYCHCMAPLTADIASTPDGRAKLMDGDQKVKARVQKMEAICVDGVKNKRQFAP
jgi:hypothetical protein